MEFFVLLSMVFLHIVDDYCLQGILANMKQIQWWKDNYPDKMYENDWVIALILHGFSWTFMTMLPLFIFDNDLTLYAIAFIINWIIHCIVDHLKANERLINLTQDQAIHIIQIIITFAIFVTH